jgi:hypothetical protein
MEIDIYVPSLAIGFEYQGNYHYQTHWSMGNAESVQKRDQEKEVICKQLGITLIAVPYWWKKDVQYIEAILSKQRPDILQSKVNTMNGYS